MLPPWGRGKMNNMTPLRRSVAEELSQQGFAFIPSFAPSDLTDASMELFGNAWSTGSFPLTQHLRPRAVGTISPAHYSGVFGLSAFPLHTDLAHYSAPPRYFVLRTVVGCDTTQTTLVDGLLLACNVGRERLARSLVRGRQRPFNNRLLRLLETSETERIRWDSLFLVPASAAGQEGCDLFSKALKNLTPDQICLASPGDTLIVDNWRMLHGRSGVISHASGRHLMRAYYHEIEGIA